MKINTAGMSYSQAGLFLLAVFCSHILTAVINAALTTECQVDSFLMSINFPIIAI